MITVTQPPKEGAVVNVKTSSPPQVNDTVEFIKGRRAVAIGIVLEVPSPHTYTVLVVASEAGPQ